MESVRTPPTCHNHMLAAARPACMRVRVEGYERQARETRAGAERDACERTHAQETERHESPRETGIDMQVGALATAAGASVRTLAPESYVQTLAISIANICDNRDTLPHCLLFFGSLDVDCRQFDF
jgi:hypothetical protein